MRALVVDDNVAVLSVLSRFLEEQGFVVAIANDGEEALEAVRRQPPEVMFLDVYLPKVSGLEVLCELRSEGVTTTVFTMSGLPDDQMVRDSLELGAADFLAKPLDLRRIEQDLQERL